MSKRLDEARALIHQDPLPDDVRSQLHALQRDMDELERFEMQYLWEVLLEAEVEQGLNVDES